MAGNVAFVTSIDSCTDFLSPRRRNFLLSTLLEGGPHSDASRTILVKDVWLEEQSPAILRCATKKRSLTTSKPHPKPRNLHASYPGCSHFYYMQQKSLLKAWHTLLRFLAPRNYWLVETRLEASL